MESAGTRSSRNRGSNRNRHTPSDPTEPVSSAGREPVEKSPGRFRFEDLEIWKMGIDITDMVLDITKSLKRNQENLLADRLAECVLNIPDPIAAGSGSGSDSIFDSLLDQARQNICRTANMLLVLHHRELISDAETRENLEMLNILARRISNFQRILKPDHPRTRR